MLRIWTSLKRGGVLSESWAVVIGARLREFAVVVDDDGKRMDWERPKRARWSEATGVATVTSNPSHTPKTLAAL